MFENDAAAAEALATANAGDVATPEVPSEQAPVQTDANNQVDAGTTPTTESFTNIDINSLPEELRPIAEAKIKEFQADYTRKTQEIAPIRQIMQDTGMSADEARQALDFVQGLNDPQNLRQLFEHLQGQFGEETSEQTTDDEGLVDPRDRQIEDLSSRLGRFEEQQAIQSAQRDMSSAEQAIRTAHPDWKDQDIERVQSLAVAHMHSGKDIKGAMEAAATDFGAWRDEVLSTYVSGKGTSTNGVPAIPGATTHAQTPETFKNLDDATKAALARFGADWAN